MQQEAQPTSDGGQQAAHACPSCGSEEVGTLFCRSCHTQVVPVEVLHAVGPMWAVNGQVVSVDAGEDPRMVILSRVAGMAVSALPVRVIVRDGVRETRVALRHDGSSVAQGDDPQRWAGPPAAAITPGAGAATATVSSAVVGVHATAGATTWARLLSLPEALLTDERAGQVVLVGRSTPAGIDAAKRAVQALGTAAVDAVLVVADAPGKPVPAAVREQRVLAGAVTVVPVPWMPRLRAVSEISPQLAGQLARPVQRVSKALLGAAPTILRGNSMLQHAHPSASPA